MTTAAQRLLELSGRASGVAGALLAGIGVSGITAGQRLLSRSSVSAGTAAALLLDAGLGRSVGGGPSRDDVQAHWDLLDAKLRNERERGKPAPAPAKPQSSEPPRRDAEAAVQSAVLQPMQPIELPGVMLANQVGSVASWAAPSMGRLRPAAQTDTAARDDEEALMLALALLALD